MPFPTLRPRRLRATPALRRLVRETSLGPSDFIWPLFFSATLSAPKPISTMPGVVQWPVSSAAKVARDAASHGLGAVLLFGLPKSKDARGSSALDPAGPVPRAIQEMKSAVPDLMVMTDVCVDEYTDHGHCGILRDVPGGEPRVDNDATLEVLAEMALVHARAGADVVAPSDMMDGRVARIRRALDEASFEGTCILSYAVKYASSFYGPFREAADCAPKFGDRSTYQMDPGNAREALREARLDEDEGADMLMVKPALSYLDVIRSVREKTTLPVFAYNVSGEYSMLQAAAAAGMLDYPRAMMEVLTSIRRAGADAIVSYHAIEAAEALG
jgi:porphobilinogen synthase